MISSFYLNFVSDFCKTNIRFGTIVTQATFNIDAIQEKEKTGGA